MKAFSNENKFKDSSSFKDNQVVEHLTSFLTINPYKGCSLNCAYCFRYKWHPSSTPKRILDDKESILKLINHPKFIKNFTPISVNVSSTDPLLPSVKESTFNIISTLESLKLKNPFVIITKLELNNYDINFLNELKYVKPIITVSLSFLNKQIEPASIKPRLNNLIKLNKSNILTILNFRPIIKGYNDTDEIFRKILTLSNKYADVLSIGGLRMSSEIFNELKKREVNIEMKNVSFKDKILDKEIEIRLINLHKQLGIQVPMFKHTSCAISYLLNIPNYNNLFLNEEKNCLSTCPESQKKICNRK